MRAEVVFKINFLMDGCAGLLVLSVNRGGTQTAETASPKAGPQIVRACL